MTHPILGAYHRRLKHLDFTRKRMESLHGDGHVTLRDISSVYEALFLRAVVAFELYCETLFYNIMTGGIRYSERKAKCKLIGVSAKTLRAILLQEKKYLDWLPYDNTINRAKLYIHNPKGDDKIGRPFVELDAGEKSQLSSIYRIRNAIAHSSTHALAEFTNKVIGNRPLPPQERTPCGFLRSLASATPRQTQFEVWMAALGSIATSILGTPIPGQQ
jgi:hypothetical protein